MGPPKVRGSPKARKSLKGGVLAFSEAAQPPKPCNRGPPRQVARFAAMKAVISD